MIGERGGSAVSMLTTIASVIALGAVTTSPTADPTDTVGRSDTAVAGEVARAAPTSTTTTEPTTLPPANHHRANVTVDVITVHAAPSRSSEAILELPRIADLRTPQTFLIDDEVYDGTGEAWYHVLLPTPPNGSKGWVAASDVTVTGLTNRIVVHLSEFRLEVLDGDRLVREFPIGVGTVDTPTPGGEYYIKEAYELIRTTSAYGSFALGLNGYSTVLDYWRGGGVIGIHGTNRPESIGQNASHGCMRMHNDDVEALVDLAPLGTPVTILA